MVARPWIRTAMLAPSRTAVALALALTVLPMAHHAQSVPRTLGVDGRSNANVSLAASGPFVVAVWSASLGSGETDVYAAISRDGGRGFDAPVRVNTTPGQVAVNGEQPPRVALRPRDRQTPAVAVVWTAKGPNGTRLLSAESRDGGQTFAASTTVPGTDAPGNRGWEALGLGPGGRFFTAWLDHRKLAPSQQAQATAGHQHQAPGTAAGAAAEGVAMAQLSQLYVASIDGTAAAAAVTGGVCYCCKTAIAAGPGGALYVAWRHVYANNMRDIAFTVSRDGGRTFSTPVRVSEDQWQINGCPDDGPTIGVDDRGAVHVVWPTVVTERSGPVKALFHAVTRDGRTFGARQRIPTMGQANHPQLAIDPAGTLGVTWDESGSGTRTLAAATGRTGANGQVVFTRLAGASSTGVYPSLAVLDRGAWLRAATSAGAGASRIQLDIIP